MFALPYPLILPVFIHDRRRLSACDDQVCPPANRAHKSKCSRPCVHNRHGPAIGHGPDSRKGIVHRIIATTEQNPSVVRNQYGIAPAGGHARRRNGQGIVIHGENAGPYPHQRRIKRPAIPSHDNRRFRRRSLSRHLRHCPVDGSAVQDSANPCAGRIRRRAVIRQLKRCPVYIYRRCSIVNPLAGIQNDLIRHIGQ